MPVLTVLAAWGDAHLEKAVVRNKHTGRPEPERIAPAQNIEDTLALISPRHATPLLWALKARGTATAKSLAAEAMPTYTLAAVYLPLDRLVADGLMEATGTGTFQLTVSGQALAPVFQAVSAWASGHPPASGGAHPLWGQAPTPSQTPSGPWLTTQSRPPAPAAPAVPTAPALATASSPATAWKSSDLFSHHMPARPLSTSPAGGPRR